MSKPADMIWGSINFDYSKWYPFCIKHLMACDEIPKIAVVLEVEPIPMETKKELYDMTDGIMDWYFVSHGMSHIENINNDNARNLRYLIPKLKSVAKEGDLIALIEQDVIMLKKDWIEFCKINLEKYDLISSAGSFSGKRREDGRREKPKPYCSIFKASDCDMVTNAIKTNRGSFVTLNIENTYGLSKHQIISGKSHAFGCQESVWGIHVRGGTNHNGKASTMLNYYSNENIRKLKKKLSRSWER